MTDFFGGILDDIRSIGDDVEGFFDSSIGKALGKGALALTKKSEAPSGGPKLNEGFIDGYYNNFSPRQRSDDLTSEDFYSVETRWLQRARRFANMDTGTDVKMGSK